MRPNKKPKNKYNEKSDSRDWTYLGAKQEIQNATIEKIDYRPFDTRYTLYSPKSKGILSYPRNEIMQHMVAKENYGLLLCKQQSTFDFQHAFITKYLSDKCSVSLQTKEASYHFPLYLYHNDKSHLNFGEASKTPNLDFKLISQFASGINHTFVSDENILVDLPTNVMGAIYPLNVMDYIYSVLHSPSYREKYKEFLKIDFPRVPYPTDADKFWKLVALGKELREIHLLESPIVEEYITGYPEDGDNIVGKPTYKNGSVFINETQYFSNVMEVAWNFYIGGYQPAQKWLKDRKDRELSYDDILHYQKIIVALSETDRIMKEIDKIESL